MISKNDCSQLNQQKKKPKTKQTRTTGLYQFIQNKNKFDAVCFSFANSIFLICFQILSNTPTVEISDQVRHLQKHITHCSFSLADDYNFCKYLLLLSVSLWKHDDE